MRIMCEIGTQANESMFNNMPRSVCVGRLPLLAAMSYTWRGKESIEQQKDYHTAQNDDGYGFWTTGEKCEAKK
jgi:hypothetical protein